MKGLCSYCSRYFFCSKRPKQNEEDVILCSSFTQNNDNEENIWEQRRYEIAKDVAAGLVQRPNYIIENRQKESKLNRNPTYQVDPSTVCQFTGLKDSEGKEIWEGDIVHDSYDLLCIDNLYEVVYIEEEGAFAFKSLDKVDNYEPFVNLLEAYVVGNKFDKED